MNFLEQKIPKVYLIEPEPFVDNRGLFRRHFCQREFAEHGIFTDIKQCNMSENKFKQTLRGFHYQRAPHGEGKILSCFKGAIYDIIVDLRPESSAYLQWISVELNEDNRLSLHVPPGCANAYLTLVDNTWIFYYHSEFYAPHAEEGICYNDPFFRFKWPAVPVVISEKDQNYPAFIPEDRSIVSDKG